MRSAPTEGAARMMPSPVGPTLRMSVAYIGSRATAPPKSTANMSSVMAARMTFAGPHEAQALFERIQRGGFARKGNMAAADHAEQHHVR